MASPSPVPGAPRVRAGSPWWNRWKTGLLVRRRDPGPVVQDVEDDLGLDDPDPQLDARLGVGSAFSSRFRTIRRSSLALARTGPAGHGRCPPTGSPAAGPARLLEHHLVEVHRGLRGSLPRRPRRRPTGRPPAPPSRSSHPAPRHAAPRSRRVGGGQRQLQRDPLRGSGLCRSCETSATRRRCRWTASSTRVSIRFMVAASRPTSSRPPSSATPRSGWSGSIASTSARMRSSRTSTRPSTSHIRTASSDGHRATDHQRAAYRARRLLRGLDAGPDHHGHGRGRGVHRRGPRPGRSRSRRRLALDGRRSVAQRPDRRSVPCPRCSVTRPGRCRRPRPSAPRPRRSRCAASTASPPPQPGRTGRPPATATARRHSPSVAARGCA